MLELHIISNNRKELEATRQKYIKALENTCENWDAIVTNITTTTDLQYAKSKESSLTRPKYLFIVQIGLDTGPLLQMKVDDKTSFLGWFPNNEEPIVIHEL